MTFNTKFTADENNVKIILYKELAKELLDNKIYYSEIEVEKTTDFPWKNLRMLSSNDK